MSNMKQEGMIPPQQQQQGMQMHPQAFPALSAMMGQPMMMPGMMNMLVPKPHAAPGGMVADANPKNTKSSYGSTRFKKAPDAPKRFKSAFIIFSAEKHKEIKDKYAEEGRTEKTTDIAKIVSRAWREMDPEEKEKWEEKARQDKARYEMERSMYKGPWKIPANKRTPKDPSAPKRPMSAFLAFSNKRRAGLKRENPDATNADLSKMLSKKWKEIDPVVKKEYMDEEAEKRALYKVEMAKWRKRVAEEKKAERKEREAIAIQAAETRQNDVGPNGQQQGQNAPDMSSNQGFPNAGMYGFAGMPVNAMPTGDFSGGNMQSGAFGNPGLMNHFSQQPFMGGSAALQQLLAQQQAFQQQGQMGQRGMMMYGQGMQGMMPGQGGDNSGSGQGQAMAPSFFQGDMNQQQQGGHQPMNMADPQMSRES